MKTIAQTELCLCFIQRHLPTENVKTIIPAVMSGYTALLGSKVTPDQSHSIANIRHICPGFLSQTAWRDALFQHTEMPEYLRCFDVCDQSVTLRTAAATDILELLTDWLEQHTVPWKQRSLSVAKPGDATIKINSGRHTVDCRIPQLPDDAQPDIAQYPLRRRASNPPIVVTMGQLKKAATQVDDRERQDDWPSESLPPLELSERLDKITTEDISGFYNADSETFTINEATHVVGMLSSGKTTFVTALVFALTLDSTSNRIALIVPDTMQGARWAARLRKHSIAATVLSSHRNRTKHLNTIHWHRSLDPSGQDLATTSILAEGFSTACPLDGFQNDPEVIIGNPDNTWPYPDFAEKQCRSIIQNDSGAHSNQRNTNRREDNKACPLWAVCPSQSQQRDAVNATVLIMTTAAFVFTRPDTRTTRSDITMPELVQFDRDLVIVDECDQVQATLDNIFAPQTLILGDDRSGSYITDIVQSTAAALASRSGGQFGDPFSARWQARASTYWKLVGVIYSLLLKQGDELKEHARTRTTFTAGSILCSLWRKQAEHTIEEFTLDDPVFSTQLQQVITVVGSINQHNADNNNRQHYADPRFEQAEQALQDLARRILLADHYDAVIPRASEALAGPLSIFNAPGLNNAYAIVLAVVTELALSQYYWLVKTQPAVEDAFRIGEDQIPRKRNSGLSHYSDLLPTNPATALFGFLYDPPDGTTPADDDGVKGGNLTLLTHYGPGRHLLIHLHDLLAAEGQAGPHVLMLSGTSRAAGSQSLLDPVTGDRITQASPSFDVQHPVRGLFLQPPEELAAINDKSVFSLIYARDKNQHQYRISGSTQNQREQNLRAIAKNFAAQDNRGRNRFQYDWDEMEQLWGTDAITDRRRTLLVTNSYEAAAIVADTLSEHLNQQGKHNGTVFCMVGDPQKTDKPPPVLHHAQALSRSLVERFGDTSQHSILVAPIQVVSRGHNILNKNKVAAISSIYFLHRAHPSPSDMGATIGRLNRFSEDRFDRGISPKSEQESVVARAQRMRFTGNHIVRHSLDAGRVGYQALTTEYKGQFAWDMLAQLWQTTGRGIRGGCPVFVGFVDYAFAPRSFDSTSEKKDTPASSSLVQCITQIDDAIRVQSNLDERKIARHLYQPFYNALMNTRNLR